MLKLGLEKGLGLVVSATNKVAKSHLELLDYASYSTGFGVNNTGVLPSVMEDETWRGQDGG